MRSFAESSHAINRFQCPDFFGANWGGNLTGAIRVSGSANTRAAWCGKEIFEDENENEDEDEAGVGVPTH
jgi:hypothetical protein